MAKALDDHIEITPGVAGGKPRIAGRRITVQNIAIWHERMGKSADEIATEHVLTQRANDLLVVEAGDLRAHNKSSCTNTPSPAIQSSSTGSR